MKPDQSPVLRTMAAGKRNQSAHAAVFSMPLIDGDLQQCADSVIRIYSEYFWKMGDYDKNCVSFDQRIFNGLSGLESRKAADGRRK